MNYLKGSCDYTRTFSRCGLSSGGAYLVFCGLDLNVASKTGVKVDAKFGRDYNNIKTASGGYCRSK